MIGAAIYARISKDPQGTSLGVARQESDCRALAAQRGWAVSEAYVDNDMTAYTGRPRPAYQRLLNDLRRRRVNAVIVWHLDRLHRRPAELEEFIDLCDHLHVELATVQGEVDLATSSGRLYARVMGAVARHESEHKSERIRRKMLELAQLGKQKGGGYRPYGFACDRITLVSAESAVIREASKRVVAGDGLHTVATDLNRRGIPTVRGLQWSTTVLRSMLLSPRICGQREHHGAVVGRAEWAPIITPEEGIQLRALLLNPLRRKGRPVRRYLLTGMIECGLCEFRLEGRPNGGKRSYECVPRAGKGGCGRLGIRADFAEALVVEGVLIRLSSPKFIKALATTDADDIAREAAGHVVSDRRLLGELAQAYGNRQITLPEWLAARHPIELRIEGAEATLRHRVPSIAIDQIGGIKERWDELNIDERRDVLRLLIRSVIVDPSRTRGGRYFDPTRLRVNWTA